MNRTITAALLAALACAATPALAQMDGAQDKVKAPTQSKKLGVGDKAPMLTNVEWLQGDEVSEFRSGEVYVLDFWATWCGPCIQSIPHINEMHNQYKDKGVNIIGVAIWPRDGMVPTDQFVDDRGDAMAYRIAEDIDGKTAESFMKAAGRNGIPTAMVINQEGNIAWIGHPMDGLDEVVELVHQNKFDPKAYAAQQEALAAKAKPIEEMLRSAYAQKDWGKVAMAAEKLIDLDAKKYGGYAMLRYQALTQSDPKAASAYGRELINDQLAKDAQGLNAIAWGIVDPTNGKSTSDMDLNLAAEAATKACELTNWKDASIIDTLARVHFSKGDIRNAIRLQTQAADLASENEKDDYLKTLEEYKAAMTTM